MNNQSPGPVPGSLAINFLNSVMDVLEQHAIELKTLFSKAGLPENLMDDPSGRISGEDYVRLLQYGEALCQDPDFGLHVGESIKPGHYGVLGYACMSSKTIEDAIHRVQRYQYLVSDMGVNSIERLDGLLKFRFQCDCRPYPPRHLAEEHIAGVVSFSRWIGSADKPPGEVHFQHPEPESIAEHQRIFACPIRFNQAETAILISDSFLDHPLPQADPVVSKMMDSYAEEQLAKLPKGEGLVGEASAVLAELLQSGEPSLEKLAAALGLNSRTLQRRLKEEALSYQSLIDNIRQNLGLSYIKQERLSLTDIAFLLGFAEQSSFQRAFKRWTGETPGRYRKQLKD